MTNIDEYSPLVLAYIGDVVYEMYVRTMLVKLGNTQVDKLHKRATSHVNATAQFESFKRIEHKLTEKEISIFKRGRNAKSGVPKNADISHYHTATGLEALIGYIYLSGETERLDEIMNLIFG